MPLLQWMQLAAVPSPVLTSLGVKTQWQPVQTVSSDSWLYPTSWKWPAPTSKVEKEKGKEKQPKRRLMYCMPDIPGVLKSLQHMIAPSLHLGQTAADELRAKALEGECRVPKLFFTVAHSRSATQQ